MMSAREDEAASEVMSAEEQGLGRKTFLPFVKWTVMQEATLPSKRSTGKHGLTRAAQREKVLYTQRQSRPTSASFLPHVNSNM